MDAANQAVTEIGEKEKRAGDVVGPDLRRLMQGDPNESFSTKDLSQLLGLSRVWLEINRGRGNGPKFIKLSAHLVRYRRQDVIDWLNEHTHRSTAEYERPARPKPIGRRGKVDRIRKAISQTTIEE